MTRNNETINLSDWLVANGFRAEGIDEWKDSDIATCLIGKVLGADPEFADDDHHVVEFDGDTPEVTIYYAADFAGAWFEVEAGDVVAVIAFADGDAFIVSKRLSHDELVHLASEELMAEMRESFAGM